MLDPIPAVTERKGGVDPGKVTIVLHYSYNSLCEWRLGHKTPCIDSPVKFESALNGLVTL